LNTIVEYINSYIGSDSLQLAGSGPITSTARYISDSTGVNSAISISTIAVGIGTDVPTGLLDVVRYTTGSVNNNYQFRILNSADGLYPYTVLLLEHNNRTGSGNQGGASIVIRDGFAGVNRAGIGFDYFNSGSYSANGGTLRISNDGQGNLNLATNGVDALRVFKDQGVQIGGVSTNLSSIARLLVKGSGATSATTSLLIQNSAGTVATEIYDDRTLRQWGQAFFHSSNTISFASDRISMQSYTGFGIRYRGVNVFELYATETNDMIGMQIDRGLSIYDAGAPVLLDNSAKLQINSTNRGFLAPRMTTAQINAITTPANGLEVYNTTLAQPCFYDGIAWRKVTHSTM
jgi:hypothetical protein